MLPQTVGELKRLIADLPDSMPFNVDVNSAYGIYSESLDVEEINVSWHNGKQIKGKALVLNLVMDS